MCNLVPLIHVPILELQELARIFSELDGNESTEQRRMLIDDGHQIVESALGPYAHTAYVQEDKEANHEDC